MHNPGQWHALCRSGRAELRSVLYTRIDAADDGDDDETLDERFRAISGSKLRLLWRIKLVWASYVCFGKSGWCKRPVSALESQISVGILCLLWRVRLV